MAYFTAAQLFGDGGGFGPQVPISMSNPPGYGAANRGIGFGEQLTSAIANRSHYALGLNTDDLNTRLALFETGGLDAAYDLGVAAVVGGGRIIIKDGGAVETTSSLASQYADDISDAHFRANAFADAVGGGGFEHRSSRQTQPSIYGFMARTNLSMNANFSNIGFSEAGTLNPGGLGGDVLRFTSATAYTGSNTDITLDTDMVEISGAAPGVNGLYFIHTLGAAVSDFHLRRLDGTTPSFSSGTAVTIKLFRASVMMPAKTPADQYSALLIGVNGVNTVLGIQACDLNGYQQTGPEDAIRFLAHADTGAPIMPTNMTGMGQYRSTLSSALFGTYSDDEMRLRGGIASIEIDRSAAAAGSHEVGIIFKDLLDATTAKAALENWQRITETTVLGIGASNNGTFASPAGRIILPDSDGTPAPPTGQSKWAWALIVHTGITAIEILSGGHTGERYLIERVTLTGTGPSDTVPDEFRVTDMDGGTPVLPTTGSFTFRFISRDIFAYGMPLSKLSVSPDPFFTPGDSYAVGHVIGGQRSLATRTRAVGFGGDLAGIAFDDTAVAGDHYLKENWVLFADGDFYTDGSLHADQLVMTGSPSVLIPTTDKTINQHWLEALPEYDNTGLGKFWFDRTNSWWECLVASSALYFPITFSGRMMTTDIQVFLANTGSHNITGDLQSEAPDWGTPANAPTIVDGNTTTATGANTWTEIHISHGAGSGTVVDHGSKGYAIRIVCASVGDRVRAIRHSVRFTKVGLGGIGD